MTEEPENLLPKNLLPRTVSTSNLTETRNGLVHLSLSQKFYTFPPAWLKDSQNLILIFQCFSNSPSHVLTFLFIHITYLLARSLARLLAFFGLLCLLI